MTVGPLRVFFLEVGGIGEQDPQEVHGRFGAVNRSAVTALHEQRQRAGVIDVGVRDDDRVQRRRIELEVAPVPLAQLLQSLEEPAIEQHAAPAGGNEVHRAGDGSGRTEKLNGRGVRHAPKMHPAPARG